MGKKANYCSNISLVVPMIRILINIFSGHNLKNIGTKKSLGMLENMQLGWEIFTLTPVVYITCTVYFKKVESDLFHAASFLVEGERIKRKAK